MGLFGKRREVEHPFDRGVTAVPKVKTGEKTGEMLLNMENVNLTGDERFPSWDRDYAMWSVGACAGCYLFRGKTRGEISVGEERHTVYCTGMGGNMVSPAAEIKTNEPATEEFWIKVLAQLAYCRARL